MRTVQSFEDLAVCSLFRFVGGQTVFEKMSDESAKVWMKSDAKEFWCSRDDEVVAFQLVGFVENERQ